MEDIDKKRPRPEQRRRIALFDFDGTLVEAHLWKAFIQYNIKKRERIFISIWYFISNMFLIVLWKLKLISAENCFLSWIKGMPKLFQDEAQEKAKKFFEEVWDEYIKPTSIKSTLKKLSWHKNRGDITIIVSSSPREFLEVVKKKLKFDFVLGTESEIKENRFTGKIVPPISFGRGKVSAIKKAIEEKNFDVNFKESFAYSDSLRDLPMLKMVGNPVVVNPDEKLLEVAKKNNWQVLK